MNNEVTKCEDCTLLVYSERVIGYYSHQTIESQHCVHSNWRLRVAECRTRNEETMWSMSVECDYNILIIRIGKYNLRETAQQSAIDFVNQICDGWLAAEKEEVK